MKIIDLLNKIANGEIKEGTKLKFANDTEFCCFEGQTMTIDVNELNTEVEIIEEKQQGRWKPKKEKYWYINNCGEVHCNTWVDDDIDNFLYLFKDVFKTKQEAEEYLEYKTALLEAEKPFEYGEYNYFISVDIERKTLYLDFLSTTMDQGTIYLGTSEDVAQAFVDKWKKQILKYEFGIEE